MNDLIPVFMLGFSTGGYFTLYILKIPFTPLLRIGLSVAMITTIKIVYENFFEN